MSNNENAHSDKNPHNTENRPSNENRSVSEKISTPSPQKMSAYRQKLALCANSKLKLNAKDDELNQAAQAFYAGFYQPVADVLAQTWQTQDWLRRYKMWHMIYQFPKQCATAVDAWQLDKPDDPQLVSISVQRIVNNIWLLQKDQKQEPSQVEIKNYVETLWAAHTSVFSALRKMPADPLVLNSAIWQAIWSEKSREDFIYLTGLGNRMPPERRFVWQSSAATYYSRHYHGDLKQDIEFAFEVANAAPNTLSVLIPLETLAWGYNPEKDQMRVQEHLPQAICLAHTLLENPTEQVENYVHNLLAQSYASFGMPTEALTHFQEIGDDVNVIAWDNDLDEFIEARDKVTLAAIDLARLG